MNLRYHGYVWLVVGLAGCATLVDADAPYRLEESEEWTSGAGASGTGGTGTGGTSSNSTASGTGNNTGSQVSSGAGTSTAATSSSGGGVMCVIDGNCPGTGNACTTVKCLSGNCVTTNSPSGTSCLGGQCDGNGACKMGSGLGSACQINAQCVSGYCVDNVCCNTQCGGTCMACNGGTCGSAPLGSQELLCMTTKACDGAGTCKKANGQFCTSGSECASSNCTGMPKMCQ